MACAAGAYCEFTAQLGGAIDAERRDRIVDLPGARLVTGEAAGDANAPTGVSQLGMWLTADQHPVEMSEDQALRGALRVERFDPVDDG